MLESLRKVMRERVFSAKNEQKQVGVTILYL